MSNTTMTRVSRGLLEELRKEKEETKIPIAQLIELAWEEYKKSRIEYFLKKAEHSADILLNRKTEEG